MTQAAQVFAMWSLLRPKRIQFGFGYFSEPDAKIPTADSSMTDSNGWIWAFEDGSSLRRVFTRSGEYYLELL